MKKFFLAAFFCVSLATVSSALDSKAIVSFDGYSSNLGTATQPNQTGFTARMYNKCPLTGLDMVWGGSFYAPASQSKEIGFNLVNGVEFKAPLLGQIEVLAHSGKANVTGSPIRLFHTFSVNKNFLYSLNDKVQLGLTVELAQFSLDDSNSYVGILNSVKPVVAANIALF